MYVNCCWFYAQGSGHKTSDEGHTLMNSIAASEDGSVREPMAENVLVKEEEKEVGVVALSVYRSYWFAVGSLLTPIILFSLFLMQGIHIDDACMHRCTSINVYITARKYSVQEHVMFCTPFCLSH